MDDMRLQIPVAIAVGAGFRRDIATLAENAELSHGVAAGQTRQDLRHGPEGLRNGQGRASDQGASAAGFHRLCRGGGHCLDRHRPGDGATPGQGRNWPAPAHTVETSNEITASVAAQAPRRA